MLLALVLLAVVAVRVPFLLGGVLGYDAAYHSQAAVTILNGGLLYRDVPYTYPPLYAYTEAISIASFGNSSRYGPGKVVAQFYDIASIVLIYMLASRTLAGEIRAFFSRTLPWFFASAPPSLPALSFPSTRPLRSGCLPVCCF